MATEGDGAGQGPAKAGWYPDNANPERERLWTGERWIDWIRPVRAGRTEGRPAGWYPDNGQPGFERLWSGEMWTEEIRRVGAVSAAPAHPPVPPHPQGVPLQPVPRATTSYYDDNPPYRLGALGLWVTIAFVATIASAIAQLIANQIYIGIESDIIDGKLPQLSHVESVTHATHVTHTVTLIVEAITAILFVIWFYRAYCNLVRAGISDLRFGPGWAIGGWFIPILNFFRQKQIANDIWKASSSVRTVGLGRWREMPLWRTLNWWWGIWILSGLLGGFGGLRIDHANSAVTETSFGTVAVSTAYSSLRAERTGVWITQVGLLFAIAAAVLAILFVREISRLQDDNFEARVPGSY